MADKPASDRTEKATPERLRKAREEGQIPQAQELSSAFMFIMLLVLLALTAPSLYTWMTSLTRDGLALNYSVNMDLEGFTSLSRSVGIRALGVISPLLLGAISV